MAVASRAVRPLSWRGRRVAREERVLEHVIVAVETSEPMEFVDVTGLLSGAVHDVGLSEGLLTIHTRHTTAGLLINENEPLLLIDLAAMFERVAPESADYGHDDFTRRTANLLPGERRNGHAHCRAALLRTSESVPVLGGRLNLGRWQRVFLVEFDGGQHREIWLTMTGVRDA